MGESIRKFLSTINKDVLLVVTEGIYSLIFSTVGMRGVGLE